MALPRNEGKVKRCVRGRARKPSGSAHPGRGQHIALGGGGEAASSARFSPPPSPLAQGPCAAPRLPRDARSLQGPRPRAPRVAGPAGNSSRRAPVLRGRGRGRLLPTPPARGLARSANALDVDRERGGIPRRSQRAESGCNHFPALPIPIPVAAPRDRRAAVCPVPPTTARTGAHSLPLSSGEPFAPRWAHSLSRLFRLQFPATLPALLPTDFILGRSLGVTGLLHLIR